MRLDDLKMDQPYEVKIYRAGGWRWLRGVIVDPYSTPPTLELDDGTIITIRGGRIRPAKWRAIRDGSFSINRKPGAVWDDTNVDVVGDLDSAAEKMYSDAGLELPEKKL